MATQSVSNGAVSNGKKYLSLFLSKEEYGIEILKVREIIGMVDVTPLPRTPQFVKGVINLRGKIIPVVDLRIKFQLASTANTDLTCIIVVQVNHPDKSHTLMALVVDAVEEVVNLTEADIEPTPDFGGAVQADYILGMAKIKGQVKALLDIDAVLHGVEWKK